MKEHEKNDTLPLELSERTFPIIEQVTTGMPGGFFIYYAHGNEELIYANRALIQIFGCDGLEDFKRYTGYTFQGLVHPEDWMRVSESIQRQIEEDNNELDYVEYRIIRKDGTTRWIEDYGHFVHTQLYGDVFYVFVEDATERHLKELSDARTIQLAHERLEVLERLEHETTALRLVHEILRSGMWSMEFNRRGEMVSVLWSPEFRAMLGYQDEADFPNVLEAWSDLIHPEDKRRVLKAYYDAIDDYAGKKIYDVELRLSTKNRGWRWFRMTGKLSRQADGTPTTYVGMFVDITHQKQTDEKLRAQRKLLEQALEQANRANQAKTVFLSNMSHDIRTPMNAIMGFTTLAATHMGDWEQVKDYLGKIMSSSRHLLSLINDVLDMSRIESGKVRIEEAPCYLPDVLDELESIVQADVHAKHLEFSSDAAGLVHESVFCDRLRLKQALLNILGNAIKFTPAHGTVKIRAAERSSAPEGYGIYEFTVQDTGIGMSPEFLQHIFEPFERERTSTISGIPGTGLGMTITKNIVDLMRGTIQVESQTGTGSTFTISIPLRVSSGSLGQIQTLPIDDGEELPFDGKRVLLVEDNELNQEIAMTILEEAGFEVAVASNGAEAVEQVKACAGKPYDLVLMDLQMPVLDGCGAAKAIRALDDPKLSSLPIIATTANAFEEDKQRALAAGMDGHLGKPIEIDKLMNMLRKVLSEEPQTQN